MHVINGINYLAHGAKKDITLRGYFVLNPHVYSVFCDVIRTSLLVREVTGRFVSVDVNHAKAESRFIGWGLFGMTVCLKINHKMRP